MGRVRGVGVGWDGEWDGVGAAWRQLRWPPPVFLFGISPHTEDLDRLICELCRHGATSKLHCTSGERRDGREGRVC